MPWRIHDLARDFRLEDVWALPTPGGPDDFPRLVQGFVAGDLSRSGSAAVRALFAVRWKLGQLFGWDETDTTVEAAKSSLRGRLDDDLLATSSSVELAGVPFSPLYLLPDEFAAELANRTMHGILHLGWVSDGMGGHHGQLAVLVRPNGMLGRAYMALIKPFRHRLVYPQLLRQIAKGWSRAEVQP